MYQIKLPIS